MVEEDCSKRLQFSVLWVVLLLTACSRTIPSRVPGAGPTPGQPPEPATTSLVATSTRTATPTAGTTASLTLVAKIPALGPTSTIPPAATRQAFSPEKIGVIDQLVKSTLQQAPLPGLALGIRHGAQPAILRGYGLTDLGRVLPVRADTVFEIASLTKQFTAAAILQLVEAGKLSLDDPVSKTITGLPGTWQAVTLHQLLTHTSGIPEYLGYLGGRIKISSLPVDQPAELMKRFASLDLPLDFKPGTQYKYSNTGYYLLGLVLEKVSGLAYGEYIQLKIAAPLGLYSTTYCSTAPANLAKGYRLNGSSFELAIVNPGLAFADGGLCSTAGDLLKWQQELAEGQVVSPASYRQMTTSASLANGEQTEYGYGLSLKPVSNRNAIWHDGAIGGYSARLVYYPDDDLAVVLLSNATNERAVGPLDTLEAKISQQLLAKP